jgi:multidrug efflux system membrane fusion protein
MGWHWYRAGLVHGALRTQVEERIITMHRTKPLIGAGAIALSALAAAVLSGCSERSAKEVTAQPAGPQITAAAVLERSVTESQEFSGRIEAIDSVEIRPRVAGYIASVNLKPGAQVRKGDVLFVIDPRPYQAEASRTHAAAQAARAKADLAKVELERARQLVADKAIAQQEVDEKASSYTELAAQARAAQAVWESAQLNLGFTSVRSPIDGRVGKAEVTLGNLVDGNALLTTVVSDDGVYASFNGDEDSYLRVGGQARKGEAVSVRVGLANEEGFPHEGRLEFVDNRVDPATGSVRMRALFKNEDGALAPGLFARVQLAAASDSRKAILVADRAVGTDQNRKFVYVVTADGKAQYREVRLGPVIDNLRVVRQGLNAGDKVVVTGLQRVQSGAPVTAQTVPMDTAVLAGARRTQTIAQGATPASKGDKS